MHNYFQLRSLENFKKTKALPGEGSASRVEFLRSSSVATTCWVGRLITELRRLALPGWTVRSCAGAQMCTSVLMCRLFEKVCPNVGMVVNIHGGCFRWVELNLFFSNC